jgi:prenyl protein peptidase
MPIPLQTEDSTTLSVAQAALYSLLVTIVYVGIFYLHPKTRPSATVKRDDPAVVRLRMTLITIATAIIVLGIVPTVLVGTGVYGNWLWAVLSQKLVWNSLDAFAQGLLDILKALALTAILFVAPLTDTFYFKYQEKRDTLGYGPGAVTWPAFKQDIRTELFNVWGLRNYLVGPLSEELVFRSAILALFLSSSSGLSLTQLVFLTPLYFGVAHVHHAVELYRAVDPYPAVFIFFTTLFQFAFTTIFGWYAAFLFLRFGSVWPPVFVHAFCNALGPPSFVAVGKNSTQTLVYRLLLIVGIVGFSFSLQFLTESSNRIL